MKMKIFRNVSISVFVNILFCGFIFSQSVQTGPFTVDVISEGVFHIEDSNDSNPAGYSVNSDGDTVVNNCSDMYLVCGEDKVLLIDLSNAVQWDPTARESLRNIVYGRAGDKDIYITVTHRHGDHLGMLPAFSDDENIRFWLSEAEFSNMSSFPSDQTEYYKENASIDLGGGFVLNTMEVPGHTAHSNLYFLEDMDMVFSGDAIGSGSGVFLFDKSSFYSYMEGLSGLIKYIEDASNNINTERLIIYGGHSWQKGNLDELRSQYIYDMRTLIGKIGTGEAETSVMSTFMPFLDTNFRYGTATITWNKEAAGEYAELLGSEQ